MTFWRDGAKCAFRLFSPQRLHSVQDGWKLSYDSFSEPGWTAPRCWQPAGALGSASLASDATTQRAHSQACAVSAEAAGRVSARPTARSAA